MGMRDAQRRLCIVSLQASLASEIRAAHSAHLVIEPIPEKEGSGSNLEKSGSDIMVLPPHTGGETRPLYPIFPHSTELRGGRAKGSPRPWDWAQA
jgi:hypothetical protein